MAEELARGGGAGNVRGQGRAGGRGRGRGSLEFGPPRTVPLVTVSPPVSPSKSGSSGNHLLNFTPPPRQPPAHVPRAFKRAGLSSGAGAGAGAGAGPVTKQSSDHFLLENCDFLVRATSDLTVLQAHPLVVPAWGDVEQVIVRSHESLNCPICLGPPLAAKITRCGHVFCWACILHHVAVSEKPSERCPMCEADVLLEDLRSARVRLQTLFREHHVVAFVKVRRARDSSVVRAPAVDTQENHTFLRVRGVSAAVVAEDVLRGEEEELRGPLADPDDPFVHHALALLTARRDVLRDRCALEAPAPLAASSLAAASEFVPAIFGKVADDGEDFVFYQASDGQPLFLHSLNLRMLVEEHAGSLSACPNTLQGSVLTIDRFLMTPELFKRFRCFAHLPMGTHFGLIEVNMKHIVSPRVMHMFAKDLSTRAKERHRHKQHENKANARAKSAAALGFDALRFSDIAGQQDDNDLQSLLAAPPLTTGGANSQASQSTVIRDVHGAKPEAAAANAAAAAPGSTVTPKFAQALQMKLGAAPAPAPASAPAPAPVWGSGMVKLTAGPKAARPVVGAPDETEEERAFRPPSFQESFRRDGLNAGNWAALDARPSSAATLPADGAPAGKKKGGKQVVMLFSAGGGRSYNS